MFVSAGYYEMLVNAELAGTELFMGEENDDTICVPVQAEPLAA